MSLPMITFSLSPRRRSTLPLLARVEQEGLNRLFPEDVEQLLRRDRSLGDLLAGFDDHLLAIAAVELGPDADLVRDRVLAHFLVERAHRDVLGRHRHLAGVPGLDGVALGLAGQLLAPHAVLLALDGPGHLCAPPRGNP